MLANQNTLPAEKGQLVCWWWAGFALLCNCSWDRRSRRIAATQGSAATVTCPVIRCDQSLASWWRIHWSSCELVLDICVDWWENKHVLESGNATLQFGKASATVCTPNELSSTEGMCSKTLEHSNCDHGYGLDIAMKIKTVQSSGETFPWDHHTLVMVDTGDTVSLGCFVQPAELWGVVRCFMCFFPFVVFSHHWKRAAMYTLPRVEVSQTWNTATGMCYAPLDCDTKVKWCFMVSDKKKALRFKMPLFVQ